MKSNMVRRFEIYRFFNNTVKLEIGLLSDMVEKSLKVCVMEDKTAVVVVVASNRSVSRPCSVLSLCDEGEKNISLC